MNFLGELAALEPATVFQVINTTKLTGVAKFVTSHNMASFFFVNGELKFATIDTKKEKIGDFLVRKGLISEEQRDAALWAAHQSGERIGQAMVKQGIIEQTALVSAIRDQMKEVAFEVLKWKEGHFIFFKDVKPENEDILMEVNLDYLILEAMRRIDENV